MGVEEIDGWPLLRVAGAERAAEMVSAGEIDEADLFRIWGWARPPEHDGCDGACVAWTAGLPGIWGNWLMNCGPTATATIEWPKGI